MLGLIGDNGAGKSTLIKIICGFHQPDAGRIFVGGEEVVLKSVDHARTLGIDTVYQDLALVNELSVYHNMFLNRELVRWPQGIIDPAALITHRFALEEVAEAFAALRAADSDAVKVLVQPGGAVA